MSDLQQFFGNDGFDPSTAPKSDFTPVPPGDYMLSIDSAEVKDTKNGDGKYIKIEHTIISEQYKGRKVFNNINIYNKSQQCVNIGLGMLANLWECINGQGKLKDTSQICNKTCMATIIVKEENNVIKKYLPQPGNQFFGNNTHAQQNVSPAQTQQSTSKLPWQK